LENGKPDGQKPKGEYEPSTIGWVRNFTAQ